MKRKGRAHEGGGSILKRGRVAGVCVLGAQLYLASSIAAPASIVRGPPYVAPNAPQVGSPARVSEKCAQLLGGNIEGFAGGSSKGSALLALGIDLHKTLKGDNEKEKTETTYDDPLWGKCKPDLEIDGGSDLECGSELAKKAATAKGINKVASEGMKTCDQALANFREAAQCIPAQAAALESWLAEPKKQFMEGLAKAQKTVTELKTGIEDRKKQVDWLDKKLADMTAVETAMQKRMGEVAAQIEGMQRSIRYLKEGREQIPIIRKRAAVALARTCMETKTRASYRTASGGTLTLAEYVKIRAAESTVKDKTYEVSKAGAKPVGTGVDGALSRIFASAPTNEQDDGAASQNVEKFEEKIRRELSKYDKNLKISNFVVQEMKRCYNESLVTANKINEFTPKDGGAAGTPGAASGQADGKTGSTSGPINILRLEAALKEGAKIEFENTRNEVADSLRQIHTYEPRIIEPAPTCFDTAESSVECVVKLKESLRVVLNGGSIGGMRPGLVPEAEMPPSSAPLWVGTKIKGAPCDGVRACRNQYKFAQKAVAEDLGKRETHLKTTVMEINGAFGKQGGALANAVQREHFAMKALAIKLQNLLGKNLGFKNISPEHVDQTSDDKVMNPPKNFMAFLAGLSTNAEGFYDFGSLESGAAEAIGEKSKEFTERRKEIREADEKIEKKKEDCKKEVEEKIEDKLKDIKGMSSDILKCYDVNLTTQPALDQKWIDGLNEILDGAGITGFESQIAKLGQINSIEGKCKNPCAEASEPVIQGFINSCNDTLRNSCELKYAKPEENSDKNKCLTWLNNSENQKKISTYNECQNDKLERECPRIMDEYNEKVNKLAEYIKTNASSGN